MASDATFPEADVDGELNPGENKKFEVDAVSSDISTSKEIKKREEGEEKIRRQERKDCIQSLKKTIVISAVIVAVAGAAFAITKKLKEK